MSRVTRQVVTTAAVLLGFSGGLVAAVPDATAATVGPCASQTTSAAKAAAIHAALDATDGQSPAAQTAAVERAACVVARSQPSSTGGVASPAVSDQDTDMSVPPPTFYWDEHTDIWYLTATWKWRNTDYRADIPDQSCNRTENDGGMDGFAISLSNKVHFTTYQLDYQQKGIYGDRPRGPWEKKAAQTANNAGVGFVAQDAISMDGCNRDISMYSGSIIAGFRPFASGCHKMDSHSSFSHTWSSTGVSSISIGVNATGGAIGFGWTSTSHHWTHASQTSKLTTVC